ncbi:MAG TPA: DUF975 family protein [Verrucomicrobiae bacterium]|nr:DUF975 family protein [Verrucomicrobiae bacterium]
MAKFSIEEAIGFGWKTVKDHWMTLVPVIVVLSVVSMVISKVVEGDKAGELERSFSAMSFNPTEMLSAMSANLLSSIVSVIIAALLMRVCLQYVDGKATDFSSLFRGITPELLVKVIAASIIINILVAIGFVLLFVPGVYLALRFSQALYVMIDRNLGIMESIKESGRLTQGVKWQLILFGIVCGLVVLVGLIALVVGLIVAIPVVAVASAHVYRQLTRTVDEVAPAAAPVAAPAA